MHGAGILLTSALSGSTRLAGVIGWPVEHSRSPAIHNAAFEHCGLDLAYAAFAVRPGDAPAAVAAVRTLGLIGLSVTMPHKEAVIPALDELTERAQRLEAVNCIINRDGALIGDNTDGIGFLKGLESEASWSVEGQRVLVCGAGAAARAIIDACATAGAAEISVLNRSPDRASVAARLGGSVGHVAAEHDIERADLVVNATPIGMSGFEGADPWPVDVDMLHPGAGVVDIVYDPLETPLLAAARNRGITAIGGLSMLVGQAAVQFAAWTGLEAPFDVMVEAARP